MALGQSIFNRPSNSGRKTINVYSNFVLKNVNDVNGYKGSSLTFTFWQGSLKLSIAPLKVFPGQDYAVADREHEVSAYIKHTKAYILANEIQRVINGEIKSTSVLTGATLVSVSDGSDFGVNAPVVSIQRMDKELSKVEEEVVFICRTDFHFAIHNFDRNTADGTKDYEPYKYMDLIDIKTVLDQFYVAMTNAQAYAVHEAGQRLEDHQTLQSIAEKLGVEGFSGNNGSTSMEGNSGGGFRRATLDDI